MAIRAFFSKSVHHLTFDDDDDDDAVVVEEAAPSWVPCPEKDPCKSAAAIPVARVPPLLDVLVISRKREKERKREGGEGWRE